MKAIIFGAGKFYEKRKEKLFSYSDVERTAVIDNNPDIQGTYIDGVPVMAVSQVVNLDFDIVLLMSAKTSDMRKQLLSMGVDAEKIWNWARLESEKNRGNFRFYCGNPNVLHPGKKVLIISTDLGYNGGSLAAVYAAKALQQRKYNVVVAAPGGNPVFIHEFKNDGLNIMICPALPYLHSEELIFVEQFDIVIVNVFQMMPCAEAISKLKPVIWWIHEPMAFYEPTLEQYGECASQDLFKNIRIYAVSRIAQRGFNHYFPGRIMETLAYGIPDEQGGGEDRSKNRKMIFAVIGGVIPLKAQDIFLKAIKKVSGELKENALFWIIGLLGHDSYSDEVREMASHEPSVVLWGEMDREKIREAYGRMDVLVCPSHEETLSMVVTESMMHGNVCIVSSSVGMADYIEDGENGFIFKTGDSDDLAKKISSVFYNREQLPLIGRKARETYEKQFTLDRFGERLDTVLLQAEDTTYCLKKGKRKSL